MTDLPSSNGRGRDAYRLVMGAGVSVIAALSLMVLNTVIDTQKAVAGLIADVRGLSRDVANDARRVDKLEDRVYPVAKEGR
jgi:hypothetical protein